MSQGLGVVAEARALSVFYDSAIAVNSLSFSFRRRSVTAIIGPSGCGKSSFLRAINRMHDFNPVARVTGSILFGDEDIYQNGVRSELVRKKIGMVFQKANPFPMSIRKNVCWGPQINGKRGNLNNLVEESLRRAALWDEVCDRLDTSALSLSGGQQQRLCIARAIAMEPEILLMDEPCSALDPKSTAAIEQLILELKKNLTIVVVTHNMQQAKRISDEVIFMLGGNLIESGAVSEIFQRPGKKETYAYVNGQFG